MPTVDETNLTINIRYLCGQQSGLYIEEAAAHRQVAMTCMTYLNMDCFSLDLEDSVLDQSILCGHYVLLAYAQAHWLVHFKEGLRNSSDSALQDLCQATMVFLESQSCSNHCSNLDVLTSQSGRQNGYGLLRIETQWPRLFDLLCSISRDTNGDTSKSC